MRVAEGSAIQKASNNLRKIHVKIVLEKVMQQTWKNMKKEVKNGA